MDASTRYSILLEYYQPLLTERQQEVLHLYHDENWSLAEIGEELSISRQGVHDSLKKGETALDDYEDKLHLSVERHHRADTLDRLRETIGQIKQNLSSRDVPAEGKAWQDQMEAKLDDVIAVLREVKE